MTEMIGSVLVLAMLAIMAAKAAPVLPANLPGEPLLEVRVAPLFRFLAHRTNIMCILAVLLLGSGVIGERWISHGLFLFALVAMAGLLCFPVRYRFTSSGISPSRASFRPWTDFEAFELSGNVVRLRGTGRFNSLRLYLTARDRENVLPVLNRKLGKRRPVAKH